MNKVAFPITMTVLLLVSLLALFSILFLQYPIERYMLQDDFARLDEIESAIQNGAATEEDLAELEEKAGSSSRYIQNKALRVIGRSKTPNLDEVEIISRYLLDPDHHTRKQAILAMKDQGRDALVAIDKIRACMLHDPNQVDVSVFAAQVLGSFGADAEPALEDLRQARGDAIEAFQDMYDRAIRQIEDDVAKTKAGGRKGGRKVSDTISRATSRHRGKGLFKAAP